MPAGPPRQDLPLFVYEEILLIGPSGEKYSVFSNLKQYSKYSEYSGNRNSGYLQLTAGPPGQYSVFLNFHFSISVFKIFKIFWKRKRLQNTADSRPFRKVFCILDFPYFF